MCDIETKYDRYVTGLFMSYKERYENHLQSLHSIWNPISAYNDVLFDLIQCVKRQLSPCVL